MIANGTDIPGDAAPLPSERPTIVTIARIEERYKGHDMMVRALALVLAKVPDAQWVVIGDGSLRPGIEELARAYGVAESVRFLGAVPDEQRDAWLARATLLAMPSRLPAGDFAGEGFGIVYLEAAAYGKPVVAGNVGGARRRGARRRDGAARRPARPGGRGRGDRRGCSRDGELARRLGAAGRARAAQFAWPRVAARVQALLLDLLGSGGDGRGGGAS